MSHGDKQERKPSIPTLDRCFVALSTKKQVKKGIYGMVCLPCKPQSAPTHTESWKKQTTAIGERP